MKVRPPVINNNGLKSAFQIPKNDIIISTETLLNQIELWFYAKLL